MGEEFVAVIKLVSGEEILASVCVDETGEEPIIIAHTPVTMKMIKRTNMTSTNGVTFISLIGSFLERLKLNAID